MTDVTLDALLEAVRQLSCTVAMIMFDTNYPVDCLQFRDLRATQAKIDALIKLRHGRPDGQPAK